MAIIHDNYRNKEVIINITGHDFGGLLKMGDLIGVLNVLAYMRFVNDNPNIKFHIPDTSLQGREYVKIFRDVVAKHCDYISDIPGRDNFEGFTELWGFRESNGHYVKINKNLPDLKKKICIFPLVDAEYNGERNWSNELIQDIIDQFSTDNFSEYEKLICIKSPLDESINLRQFTTSTDFETNLNHLLECEYFVGGDTGTSHLVGALDNDKQNLLFYYNYGDHGSWLSSFTAPFHFSKPNVKMIYHNPLMYDLKNTNEFNVLQNLVLFHPRNHKTRLGVQRDGGYAIVEGYEDDYFISGGGGPEISFEFDFMNKFPNIEGVIFDGTISHEVDLPKKLTFIRKNIGSVNNESLTNLVDYIKDYKDVFLKMDIEGGEWDLFTSEFVNYLGNIKQIALEVHHLFSGDPRIIKALENINKTHHLVHIHDNNYCHSFVHIKDRTYPQVLELTYIRKDCRVMGLSRTQLPMEGIDYPNSNERQTLDLNFYPFSTNQP